MKHLKLNGKLSSMKNLSYLILAVALGLQSCGSSDKLQVPEKPIITGLASLVTLPIDTGRIDLMDFVDDVSQIDSISKVEGLDFQFKTGQAILKVKANPKTMKPFSVLKLWSKGFVYAIPLRKSVKVKHHVVLKNIPDQVASVQLAGDINNWQPNLTPLTKSQEGWTIDLNLNPGKYSYQVVTDGKWSLDRANPDSTSNGIGGFNSVMKVVGADDSKTPFISTASHENGKITLNVINGADEAIVLWENYRLPSSAVQLEGEKLEINLPDAVEKTERSSLRIFAYNAAGGANDVIIPLVKNKVAELPTELKRDDYHAAILYFMMVDRFMDGDTSNNKPVIDSRVDFKANYQGGDLQGIMQKLKEGYFKDLGVNTLWISPIVQNPEGAYQEYPEPRRWFSGYHGYWPVNTTVVDHRLGSNEVFGKLVDQAHGENMNVLMDFVSNHVHDENKIFKQHPEWFSSMYTKDGRVNIRIWDEQRLTTWFDTFMPDIDYTKPEAINAFTDSALFWVEKYNLDGFRHDATKHVSEDFWRALTRKLKNRVAGPKNRNVYQIGETFGSRELIGSYIGSGMIDAQFDFNLYFDARPVFASEAESFEKVAASLKESALYYGNHSLMGNISGNHDMPRFLYYAGGSYRQGEDEKEAGWNREIKVEDSRGYARLKMLHAFIMTIPGIPVIYYGDEIGMTGANDPDNRRMMRFSDLSPEEASVKQTVTKLGNLRKNSMPLIYGSTKVLQASKDQLVYIRQYFGKSVVIALNRSETVANMNVTLPNCSSTTVAESFHSSKPTIKGNQLSIAVQPLSFEIITLQ